MLFIFFRKRSSKVANLTKTQVEVATILKDEVKFNKSLLKCIKNMGLPEKNFKPSGLAKH